MSAPQHATAAPKGSGGAISILATMGLNYRPLASRRPSGTPVVATKASGRVKTCPGAHVRTTRRDNEVLADGGPHNNTANKMRALLCPLHPAVHERPKVAAFGTGQTPDGF